MNDEKTREMFDMMISNDKGHEIREKIIENVTDDFDKIDGKPTKKVCHDGCPEGCEIPSRFVSTSQRKTMITRWRSIKSYVKFRKKKIKILKAKIFLGGVEGRILYNF